MTLFASNLVLAFLWAAVLGELSMPNLAAGFALSFCVLALAQRLFGAPQYFAKCFRVLEFAGFFVVQLLLSSLRVAGDIVTPKDRARPGIIAVPLEARTDGEITLLANLVSLTPGSLSIDVSEDRETLYVHVMFLEDVETAVADIKDGFERRVLGLLR